MKKDLLGKFKKVFETQLTTLYFSDRAISDEFSTSADDRLDELDQATTDVEQALRFRLRNREISYLKKLEDALQRIEDGTFGECEECGEDIELKRLEARPTATLCVLCKEEQERRETQKYSLRSSEKSEIHLFIKKPA